MENVWRRLKELAGEIATRRGSITRRQAEALVNNVIAEHHVDTVPLEARHFFATELMSFVDELLREREP